MLGIVDLSDVFGLDGVERVGAKGVGEVSVEVDRIGVVADGVGDGVVATAIGTVGVGEGVDVDDNTVEKIGDVARETVAAEEGVAEPKHEVKAGDFVAVHGRGIVEGGTDKVVFVGAGDGQGKYQTAVDRGAEGVETTKSRIGVGEVVHHFDINLIGRVTVPLVHFVEGCGHGKRFWGKGFLDRGEGVGTDALRPCRQGYEAEQDDGEQLFHIVIRIVCCGM